ncbi:hypothetical protein Prudu_000980 [Prunus dulcis]|uniref:Uncharacterized protein n=1 Tax=Prunus dulcis TaxID=3755 RepID=A0A4Y1QMI1_PRUDU|nr:hypothetical protein Prudu_000980 [Prunus dulcis]
MAGLSDTKSTRATNWQDSGTVVSLIRNPGSQGPGVPKLVRQMSSALTKLKVNWMSVDIVISEGNRY